MSDAIRGARTDGRGRAAVGPTYWSRLVPWVRWGAPVMSVVVLPISTLVVIRLDWWLRYPLALLIGYVVLSAFMAAWLAITHRTAWWDPEARALVRGHARLAAAEIQGVVDDYRPQGITVVTATDGRRIGIPNSGWDHQSFEGIRVMQQSLTGSAGPGRAELLRRDRHARLSHENAALARTYGMPWKPEYEDPMVFREAFDTRRLELHEPRR